MLEEEKSPFESKLNNFNSEQKMGIKFGSSRLNLEPARLSLNNLNSDREVFHTPLSGSAASSGEKEFHPIAP